MNYFFRKHSIGLFQIATIIVMMAGMVLVIQPPFIFNYVSKLHSCYDGQLSISRIYFTNYKLIFKKGTN